jgi:hypothetical protein
MQNLLDDFQNKMDPNSKVRHLFDIVRGVMYIAIGGMILSNKNIALRFGGPIATGLGIIFMCYGLFRIWRFYYNYKNKIKY